MFSFLAKSRSHGEPAAPWLGAHSVWRCRDPVWVTTRLDLPLFLPQFLKLSEIISNSWNRAWLPIALRTKSSCMEPSMVPSLTPHCVGVPPPRGSTAASALPPQHLACVPGLLPTHLLPIFGKGSSLKVGVVSRSCLRVVLNRGGTQLMSIIGVQNVRCQFLPYPEKSECPCILPGPTFNFLCDLKKGCCPLWASFPICGLGAGIRGFSGCHHPPFRSDSWQLSWTPWLAPPAHR